MMTLLYVSNAFFFFRKPHRVYYKANIFMHRGCRSISRNKAYPIVGHQERQPLVDGIFMKLCDMVNDPMIQVREVACCELGKFESIDSDLLCQTFSKSFISHKKTSRADEKYAKVNQKHRIR
jgi:hypothetical protein